MAFCSTLTRSASPLIEGYHLYSPSDHGSQALNQSKLYKLGPDESLCISEGPGTCTTEEKSYSRAITIGFRMDDESKAFHYSFEQWKNEVIGGRTGTYYAAVIENRADFHGRVVVDVDAGSGILSLFAVQISDGESKSAFRTPLNGTEELFCGSQCSDGEDGQPMDDVDTPEDEVCSIFACYELEA